MSILEKPVQQRVASEEVFRDPWKQGQVNLFSWKWEYGTMIVNKLNIFSQNVCKNSLIISFILKTYNHLLDLLPLSLIIQELWPI